MDDVIFNKIATIEKCISRVYEEYSGFEEEFLENYTKQDSVVLNIERAAQASIDIATHIVRVKKLGLPQSSREVFILLNEHKVITKKTSENMQKMVGFRNIAVHNYQKLNLDIVCHIIQVKLDDFKKFNAELLQSSKRQV
ncbi:type VII toxin-antitoxin system HepT family RNase toxin [Bathymodiolus azoricus thioautotrophic gill symbiont]|jgi:uncharacterized protein YutE (UPF0331/DUF86 family)|uniref:Protein containing DUF86 n=1 Tax=Bathymodiolus azoricus thioautotrophic gill symbiont TaxID=235205 RepID=A0A1H6M4K8_9GAMM|nr:DUF86 domain-containing protein [Bathymodiolus azoricus thioautotrophic gill symbiont]CAC9485195.1 Protein of unknown function DUF86, SO_3166 group [uncultured Gammaproteobacteria bacterium]CAC9519832.1 Protein of unknown function DUF86, SO_3166 group [uncultured Gammaproteobacteria bacterium]CAC9999721.1 Protein of unknown function DUF86, SO_3166 group [uncultured Gammaproteobacteria bacterium]SEH92490.1 protein containing DUF86 [Bathymodiolus azoricus thioautotrophic gill symbiont]VVH5483